MTERVNNDHDSSHSRHTDVTDVFIQDTLQSIGLLSQRLSHALEEETKVETNMRGLLGLMERERLRLEKIEENRANGNIMASGIPVHELNAIGNNPAAMIELSESIKRIRSRGKKPPFTEHT
jgi:hypothetical protein